MGRVPCLVVALGLALLFSRPVEADLDCVSFSTQAQAQSYFEAGGGSPFNDFDRLDADHDGIACESLPAGGYATGGGLSREDRYSDRLTARDYDFDRYDDLDGRGEVYEGSSAGPLEIIALLGKLPIWVFLVVLGVGWLLGRGRDRTSA